MPRFAFAVNRLSKLFSMASRTCLSKIVRLVGQAAVLVAEEPSRPFHAPPSTTFCNNFAFSCFALRQNVGAQRFGLLEK